jgi:hypothetical protein
MEMPKSVRGDRQVSGEEEGRRTSPAERREEERTFDKLLERRNRRRRREGTEESHERELEEDKVLLPGRPVVRVCGHEGGHERENLAQVGEKGESRDRENRRRTVRVVARLQMETKGVS